MGQFSMEKSPLPVSVLSGNQQISGLIQRRKARLRDYDDGVDGAPSGIDALLIEDIETGRYQVQE
jgi:hypothetical protein